MKIIYAFYEQQLMGRLSRDEDLVFHFEYDDAWRKNPKAFALSLALPLRETSFGNRLILETNFLVYCNNKAQVIQTLNFRYDK